VVHALSRIADTPTQVVCSGRTDASVHAASQVCHFETEADRPSYNWVMGTNTHLPDDVSVSWVRPVPPEFHARFSAQSRQYVYVIRCVPFHTALMRHATTDTYKELNPQAMAEAGSYLIGTHDFNAYRSAQCQAKTSTRTVMRLAVHQLHQFIAIHV
jgi:Pseudouridylate synthase